MAETKVYCGGCMTKTVDGRCPKCNWHVARHLPRESVLLDRYQIGRILGETETIGTYLALDLRRKDVVALAEYLPSYCGRKKGQLTVPPGEYPNYGQQFSNDLTMFLDDGRRLATIDAHPNLCPVIEVAELNGTGYMVMPYIEGVSLRQYLCTHGGRLPMQTAVYLILAVLDGVRELHGHELLHGDLSPKHIMIKPNGMIELLCFGTPPHVISSRWPWTHAIDNWSPYTPKDGKRGPSTDVYSAGATLYQCITGVSPYSTLDRVAEDDLRPPGELCPGLSPNINAAIMKALAVRASDRFQTAMDFQTALIHGNRP